jgi:hypothetical protein
MYFSHFHIFTFSAVSCLFYSCITCFYIISHNFLYFHYMIICSPCKTSSMNNFTWYGKGIKPTNHVRYIVHTMPRQGIPSSKNFLCLISEFIVDIRNQSDFIGTSKQRKQNNASIHFISELFSVIKSFYLHINFVVPPHMESSMTDSDDNQPFCRKGSHVLMTETA